MRFFFQLTIIIGLIFSSGALADKNLGLPPLTIPDDNPQTAEKIALGRLLFNDKRFSANGSVSCASCHRADKAFTDGLPVAIGINGQAGTRNAPTVVNAAFYQTQFWDGRATSLEEQALGPFANPIEHGLTSHQAIVDVIRQDADYLKQFNTVFHVSADAITINHVVKAIAGFERTLIAGNSPFDRYYFGMDQSALSMSAARGSRIFRRKGNCANCHEIAFNNALFTDNRFYNIGFGFKRLRPVLDALTAGKNPDDLALTDVQRSELGRFNVTKALADLGKFKTPSLRNIALTAPYMHDGSMKTLEEVIEHYDKGGDKNPFIDAKIFPLHLTPQEKADLAAFMKALTSQQPSK
jgi:cytochrome c peroxidase